VPALDIALPEDALLEVCLFVGSVRDLFQLAATSRTLWQVATCDIVWRARWRRERGAASMAAVTRLFQLHPTNIALGVHFGDEPNSETGSSWWMRSFLATSTYPPLIPLRRHSPVFFAS
jgi:hypothetical protein